MPAAHGARAGEDEEQTAVAAARLHSEIPAALGAGDALQAPAEPGLISPGAAPAVDVVVPDQAEDRKVRAEDRGELRVPAGRIVLVVEVPGDQQHLGALAADQAQDRPGVGTAALVPDDRHLEIFDRLLVVQNGQGVQQSLGGMFVRAIAGINNGCIHATGKEMRNTGAFMTCHNHIDLHRTDIPDRILKRLSFLSA